MNKFSLSDRYTLEIHWKKANYNNEGICVFDDAYFCGPALAEAQKLNDDDYIMLDFFQQYLYLVRSVYVGKFSWRGTEYSEGGIVKLRFSTLAHSSELNRVPKLKDNDFLIVDTSDHTIEKHAYNLLYKTYVVDGDKVLYRFGEK